MPVTPLHAPAPTDEHTSAHPGSETSLSAARDILATAAALGLPVPAIPGTTVHWAYIDSFHDDIDLGLYATHDDALTAIRNWVIREYDEDNATAPWDKCDEDWPEARRRYLATATDETVIASLYDKSEWTIQQLTIRPTTARTI